jgi:hypothetical protein
MNKKILASFIAKKEKKHYIIPYTGLAFLLPPFLEGVGAWKAGGRSARRS